MKKLLALLLALLMVLSLVACGSKEEAAAPEKEEAPAATEEKEEAPAEKEEEEAPAEEEAPVEAPAEIKIGAILVHDENSGYDMAHIEGLNGACEALGIDPASIS